MSRPDAAPILHLRGPVLIGPEEELDGAWVVDGAIRHEPTREAIDGPSQGAPA